MGEAVERLIALSNLAHVDGYKRTTKTGKVVSVKSYTRAVGDMPDTALLSELQNLGAGRGAPQEVTRKVQVVNELRRRGVKTGAVEAVKQKVAEADRSPEDRKRDRAAADAALPAAWVKKLTTMSDEDLKAEAESHIPVKSDDDFVRMMRVFDEQARRRQADASPEAVAKREQQAALRWIENESDALNKSLTKQEQKPLLDYVKNGYKSINRVLRGVDKPNAEVTGRIRALDALFGTHARTTDRGVTAYRGMDSATYEKLSKMKPGQSLTEDGFSSLTVSAAEAEPFGQVAKIRVAPGVKYLPGDGMEGELVLPRGTTLEVVSTSGDMISLVIRPTRGSR